MPWPRWHRRCPSGSEACCRSGQQEFVPPNFFVFPRARVLLPGLFLASLVAIFGHMRRVTSTCALEYVHPHRPRGAQPCKAVRPVDRPPVRCERKSVPPSRTTSSGELARCLLRLWDPAVAVPWRYRSLCDKMSGLFSQLLVWR